MKTEPVGWLDLQASTHSHVQDVSACGLDGIYITTVQFMLGILESNFKSYGIFFIHFCFVLKHHMPQSAGSLEMDNLPVSAS